MSVCSCCFFCFTDPATTEIYTLSLHDALPISLFSAHGGFVESTTDPYDIPRIGASGELSPLYLLMEIERSEEHTSELQSRRDLVCRLLLEKKKNNTKPLNPGSAATAHDLPGAR